MKAMNKTTIPETSPKHNFDILCQEFDGGNFYGLEYILDDFFQSTTIKPNESASSSIDWFGLNN
jgi:hypothetical protein